MLFWWNSELEYHHRNHRMEDHEPQTHIERKPEIQFALRVISYSRKCKFNLIFGTRKCALLIQKILLSQNEDVADIV